MNQRNSPAFIGYANLEAWLSAISELPDAGARTLAVQSLGIVEQEADGYGLRYKHHLHIISFVAADGTVHYVRINFGATEHIADTDFGSRNAEVRARAEQGGRIIDDWLRASRLTVHRAIVATPRDLKWLDGWAGCLDWDTDAKRFRTPGEAIQP